MADYIFLNVSAFFISVCRYDLKYYTNKGKHKDGHFKIDEFLYYKIEESKYTNPS